MHKPEAKYHSHNVLPLKTSENSVETNSPATEAWAESFLSPPSGSSIMVCSLCSSQSSDTWIHNVNYVKSFVMVTIGQSTLCPHKNSMCNSAGHSLIKWTPWSLIQSKPFPSSASHLSASSQAISLKMANITQPPYSFMWLKFLF